MRCPYLRENFDIGCECKAGEYYDPDEKILSEYCKDRKKFSKCSRFQHKRSIENAPVVNKVIIFLIPIICWLSILSIMLSVNNQAINDFGNDLIVMSVGSILSIIVGAISSRKA